MSVSGELLVAIWIDGWMDGWGADSQEAAGVCHVCVYPAPHLTLSPGVSLQLRQDAVLRLVAGLPRHARVRQ